MKKLLKRIAPNILPQGYVWHKAGGRDVDVVVHGQVVVYKIIKYTCTKMAPLLTPSKVCYGKIVSRTDNEIVFKPITKKQAMKVMTVLDGLREEEP